MDLRTRRGGLYGSVAAGATIQRIGGAREVVWTMGERWFCGCLLCLSVLTLAGVITFGALTLIDLNDINGQVYPVRCNDNNPCTVDFYRFEACHSLPTKNDVDCDDVCLVGGAGTCFAGECTGECPGSCVVDGDCPDIIQYNEIPFNKECQDGGCTYRNFDAISPSFLFSAGSSDHLGEKFCEAFIAADEPLRSCLEIVPFWPLENLDLDAIICIYAFRCNAYQRIFVD